MVEAISTEHAPGAIGPYSQAIKTSTLLFCSGQIPLDPKTGQIVPGGVQEQTHQCMRNLKAILDASKRGFGDVVKTTIFLKDLGDFAAVNEVYGSYFKAPFPARACVEVARLPRDVLVEIEAIAQV